VIQVFEAHGFAQIKSRNWPDRRRAMCRHTFQMLKQMGRMQKAAEPSLPCIINLWDPCTTLKHFLRCTITSIASNFHLTWPKIHGWLHRDRVLLNLISFTGKESN
jgi:hypothetical protein